MARPHGAVNEKTRQVQKFCRSICEDPLYQQAILERARNNTLGPFESVIWAYAWGRPKLEFSVELFHGEEDLSALSLDELAERNREIQHNLEEAKALKNAIDVSQITAGTPEP
jgi:hypothetical protein